MRQTIAWLFRCFCNGYVLLSLTFLGIEHERSSCNVCVGKGAKVVSFSIR